YIKQSYLLSAEAILSAVNRVDGLDPKTAHKVDFYKAIRVCHGSFKFSCDQPGGIANHDQDRRRESSPRSDKLAGGPRTRARRPRGHYDRSSGVSSRGGRSEHTGKGDLPE